MHPGSSCAPRGADPGYLLRHLPYRPPRFPRRHGSPRPPSPGAGSRNVGHVVRLGGPVLLGGIIIVDRVDVRVSINANHHVPVVPSPMNLQSGFCAGHLDISFLRQNLSRREPRHWDSKSGLIDSDDFHRAWEQTFAHRPFASSGKLVWVGLTSESSFGCRLGSLKGFFVQANVGNVWHLLTALQQ